MSGGTFNILKSIVGRFKEGATAANKSELQRTLFEAMLDPSLAVDLMKSPTSQNIKGVVGRLKEVAQNATIAGGRGGILATNSTSKSQAQRQQEKEVYLSQLPNQQSQLSNPYINSVAAQGQLGKGQTVQQAPTSQGLGGQGSTSPNTSRKLNRSQELADTLTKPQKATPQRELSGEVTSVNNKNPLRGFDNVKNPSIRKLIASQPPIIRAIIKQESAGKPRAISSAGARGLMQLMPGTAKELGVNPDDPADNIKGGTKYIEKQLRSFKDTRLALAAYNWGPGNMRKHLKRMGTTNWAKLAASPHMPKETKNYVMKVLGNYKNFS